MTASDRGQVMKLYRASLEQCATNTLAAASARACGCAAGALAVLWILQRTCGTCEASARAWCGCIARGSFSMTSRSVRGHSRRLFLTILCGQPDNILLTEDDWVVLSGICTGRAAATEVVQLYGVQTLVMPATHQLGNAPTRSLRVRPQPAPTRAEACCSGWGSPLYHAVPDVLAMHITLQSDMWMVQQRPLLWPCS